MLGRVVVSILSIVRIVRQGQLIREEDECKIIVTEREIDPFSWMRYIVLQRKDWEGQHIPFDKQKFTCLFLFILHYLIILSVACIFSEIRPGGG